VESEALQLEHTRIALLEPGSDRPICDELIINQLCQVNPRFLVEVHRSRRTCLLRIRLFARKAVYRGDSDEFQIARDLYTYDAFTMLEQFTALSLSVRPDEYCEQLVRPWNCFDPDGPISLDATPAQRIALVPNQPPLESAA
jgi:hypothetical protein